MPPAPSPEPTPASVPEPAAGRQRLDVEERKAAILDAARAAYAAAPYAEVPIAQIAAAANSSQALVFHYFGSKAGLYTAVVADAVAQLRGVQDEKDAALPPGTSTRDRVRTSLYAYLDHVASHPVAWSAPLRGGVEPAQAQAVRAQARADYVDLLLRLLGVKHLVRHRYAVWGYFGFLDSACLHWVDAGCPASERDSLVAAALGALEGALGDWAT